MSAAAAAATIQCLQLRHFHKYESRKAKEKTVFIACFDRYIRQFHVIGCLEGKNGVYHFQPVCYVVTAHVLTRTGAPQKAYCAL